ncbi:MAG: hypothetical protein ACE5G5_05440 [Candidatus Methylomirabilales bacterium]
MNSQATNTGKDHDWFYARLHERLEQGLHEIQMSAKLLNLMEGLVQRLDRQERRDRRLKWIAGLGLFAIAAVLIGQATAGNGNLSKVVQSEQFLLRDGGGKARAWLNVSDGAVNLALADSNETRRAMLSVAADGTPGLGLYDKNERKRVTLGMKWDGLPFLAFHGTDEKVLAGLDVMSDGSLTLGLNDSNGAARVALATYSDGSPLISLINGDGEVSISVSPHGSPALLLYGKNGDMWKAP